MTGRPIDLTPEEEKTTLNLIRRTFEAALDSSSMPSTSPLCLRSLLTAMIFTMECDTSGGMLLEEGEIDRFPILFNTHPSSFNAAISWALGLSSEEKVESAASSFPRSNGPSTLECTRCDQSDRWIADLHTYAMVLSLTDDQVIHRMGRLIFDFTHTILKNLDWDKLISVNDREKLTRKHKGYEALSHFIVGKPEAFIHATCAWYKVHKCAAAMHSLSDYFSRETASRQDAVRAMDPEATVLMLEEMLKNLRSAHKNGRIELDEVHWCLTVLSITKTLVSTEAIITSSIDVTIGPKAKQIYDLICSMLRIPDSQLTFYMGDLVRANVLPALADQALLIHHHFGETKGLGPLHPHIKRYRGGETTPQQEKYLGMFSLLTRFKLELACANLLCKKKPQSAQQPFKRCGKCKIPSYCSPECQRAAWSDPDHTHKRACKTWALLNSVWPKTSAELTESMVTSMKGMGPSIDMGRVYNMRLKELAEKEGVDERTVKKVFEYSQEMDVIQRFGTL